MEKNSRGSVIRSFCQLARLAVSILLIQFNHGDARPSLHPACLESSTPLGDRQKERCLGAEKWDSCVSRFLVHHVRSSGTVGLGFV